MCVATVDMLEEQLHERKQTCLLVLEHIQSSQSFWSWERVIEPTTWHCANDVGAAGTCSYLIWPTSILVNLFSGDKFEMFMVNKPSTSIAMLVIPCKLLPG